RHGLATGQGIGRSVRERRGHGAVVAGVHRLEHVQGGFVTDLAHDDAVGAHTQGVDHELADGDLAFPFNVGRARLQRDHMLLAELQFGRVFYRDDALVVRDELRKDVEQRGFTGTGAARDHDVQARFDTRLEELQGFGRDAAELDELLDGDGVFEELTDGDHRPHQRDGRDDGVHTGAVGQAGVYVGAGLVDAAPQRGHDAVDDAHHVLVALEGERHALDFTLALDVDVFGAVDHDFSNGVVLEQGLQRAKAQDLSRNLLEQAVALGPGEDNVLLVQDLLEQLLDGGAHLGHLRDVHRRIQLGQQAVLHAHFQVQVGVALGVNAGRNHPPPLHGAQAGGIPASSRCMFGFIG